MIIVKLTGGIGNQMFQYAAGRALAIQFNTELKLDISGYEHDKNRGFALHYFNTIISFASPIDLLPVKLIRKNGFVAVLINNLPFYSMSSIVEKSVDSYNSILAKIKGNVYLDGYWQSESYFKTIKNIIKDEFCVKLEPDEINKKILYEIQNRNSICLHIRRGDYVNDSQTNLFHGVLPLEYYSKAIEMIAERVEAPHFYVFSDDPAWVPHNLNISYPATYVSHNNQVKDYEDLRLMYNCKHFIVANSSFSWWGAWLSQNCNKIIIAPEKWIKAEINEFNNQLLLPSQMHTLRLKIDYL